VVGVSARAAASPGERLVAGRVLTPAGLVPAHVRFGERILNVEPDDAVGGPAAPIVAPGFVDEHVHGGGGGDAMDGEEGVRALARHHLRHGTTALLPTTQRARQLDRITVLLHQFVTLTRGGEQVKMSTRRAEYVTLDELLDEIARQIGAELRTKKAAAEGPRVVGEITPERLDTMARDAVRYFYSMRRMESHLEFDLDLAVSQSMQNPVYYLQYAHARICSIFAKWTERRPSSARGGDTATDFTNIPADTIARLVEPEEIRIIKLIARFPALVEAVADSYETHRISEYLHTIARELQGYYEKHRVLGKDKDLTLARLALIHAVRTVLANGLTKLLGISAPETM